MGSRSVSISAASAPDPKSSQVQTATMDLSESKRLEAELTAAMRRNVREMTPLIGPRTRFTPMLNQHGAVEAWRRLKVDATIGFTALWEAGRLDLSLEALVVEHPKYHVLFHDNEIAEMRTALGKLGYEVQERDASR